MIPETNELLNKTLGMLDTLAEKIGTTTKQLWPYMVRQQYIKALQSSSVMVVALCVSLILFLWAKKLHRKEHTRIIQAKVRAAKDIEKGKLADVIEPDDTWCAVSLATVISSVLFIVSLIVSLCYCMDCLNPEYGALEDLLRLLRH